MVGRIGKMLRFERHGAAVSDLAAEFPARSVVEKVSAVKLYSGLVCEYLHLASACRIIERRHETHRTRKVAEHPVVVVPVPVAKLFVVGVDTRPDESGGAEIGAIRPVGISTLSTGVVASASIHSS